MILPSWRYLDIYLVTTIKHANAYQVHDSASRDNAILIFQPVEVDAVSQSYPINSQISRTFRHICRCQGSSNDSTVVQESKERISIVGRDQMRLLPFRCGRLTERSIDEHKTHQEQNFSQNRTPKNMRRWYQTYTFPTIHASQPSNPGQHTWECQPTQYKTSLRALPNSPCTDSSHVAHRCSAIANSILIPRCRGRLGDFEV